MGWWGGEGPQWQVGGVIEGGSKRSRFPQQALGRAPLEAIWEFSCKMTILGFDPE